MWRLDRATFDCCYRLGEALLNIERALQQGETIEKIAGQGISVQQIHDSALLTYQATRLDDRLKRLNVESLGAEDEFTFRDEQDVPIALRALFGNQPNRYALISTSPLPIRRNASSSLHTTRDKRNENEAQKQKEKERRTDGLKRIAIPTKPVRPLKRRNTTRASSNE